MKVIKAVAVAASKSIWASLYDLEIWLEGYDLSKKGKCDYVSYDELNSAHGGKKGLNFKRVNAFLSTEEGLKWLNDLLNSREVKR